MKIWLRMISYLPLTMIIVAMGLNRFFGDGEDVGILYAAFWIIVAIMDK
jgi:hypothetical protein